MMRICDRCKHINDDVTMGTEYTFSFNDQEQKADLCPRCQSLIREHLFPRAVYLIMHGELGEIKAKK
jgi:phage FluMu protein Com